MEIKNNQKNASSMKREYWPTREWQKAEPEFFGMDPHKLKELNGLINSLYGNIEGLIIVRRGYILFEEYYNNSGPLVAHNVTSITKSIMSALIGIAIDRGMIKGVDEKILRFFPDYKSAPGDTLKRSLTIKNLLTMTAPIAMKSGPSGNEALDRLRRQRNWVKFILDQLGRSKEPGKFHYSTSGSHLLSAILTKATGMTAREFGNIHLFAPLGMKEVPDCHMNNFSLDDVFGKNVEGWIKDPQGYTTGGWGLTLTLRDMARFGFLYLNHGLWEGQRIISEKWICDSTTSDERDYGYLWWLKDKDEFFSYSARGTGGSLIRCYPDKDLIVGITTRVVRKPPDPEILFQKCIIPAILK